MHAVSLILALTVLLCGAFALPTPSSHLTRTDRVLLRQIDRLTDRLADPSVVREGRNALLSSRAVKGTNKGTNGNGVCLTDAARLPVMQAGVATTVAVSADNCTVTHKLPVLDIERDVIISWNGSFTDNGSVTVVVWVGDDTADAVDDYRFGRTLALVRQGQVAGSGSVRLSAALLLDYTQGFANRNVFVGVVGLALFEVSPLSGQLQVQFDQVDSDPSYRGTLSPGQTAQFTVTPADGSPDFRVFDWQINATAPLAAAEQYTLSWACDTNNDTMFGFDECPFGLELWAAQGRPVSFHDDRSESMRTQGSLDRPLITARPSTWFSVAVISEFSVSTVFDVQLQLSAAQPFTCTLVDQLLGGDEGEEVDMMDQVCPAQVQQLVQNPDADDWDFTLSLLGFLVQVVELSGASVPCLNGAVTQTCHYTLGGPCDAANFQQPLCLSSCLQFLECAEAHGDPWTDEGEASQPLVTVGQPEDICLAGFTNDESLHGSVVAADSDGSCVAYRSSGGAASQKTVTAMVVVVAVLGAVAAF